MVLVSAGRRNGRRRFAALMTIATTIALSAILASGLSALATPPGTQDIPDTCNQGGPNTGQFYANGPPGFWHDATDSHAFDTCLMWTWNETEYTNMNDGNQAFWYNCVQACTADFALDAFIPSVDASTTHAEYQIWTEGHLLNSPTYICAVNQDSLNDVFASLCSDVSPIYVCGTMSPSCGGFILLQDGTGERVSTTKVGYDEGYYGYVSG